MAYTNKFIVLGARKVRVLVGFLGRVEVRMRGYQKDGGIIPGYSVMLSLTADEARSMARRLERVAAESDEVAGTA